MKKIFLVILTFFLFLGSPPVYALVFDFMPTDVEISMSSEMQPSDRLSKTIASGSAPYCSGSDCYHSTSYSNSGTFTSTYKYAYLYSYCSSGYYGWASGYARAHLYYKNSEVESDYTEVSCPPWSDQEEDWDKLTVGETYSWSVYADASWSRISYERVGKGSANIQEYEQGYKLKFDIKNTLSSSKTRNILIQVRPTGSSTVLGEYSATKTLSGKRTISVFPTYKDGKTWPTSEYVVDRKDSSNGEYYVDIKIDNYLYQTKVKWTPDSLEILEPLHFVPNPDSEITSVKAYDTSQSAWRNSGDIFVLPTGNIDVLIRVKNTGNIPQDKFFVGTEFWKVKIEGSKSDNADVYYDGELKQGGCTADNGGSCPSGATCSLNSDPNNNGILDIGETISVKCSVPASYWGVVNIDRGERLNLRVHETDKDIDIDVDGTKGEWLEDALAMSSSSMIEEELISTPSVSFQGFEGDIPTDWSTNGARYSFSYRCGGWDCDEVCTSFLTPSWTTTTDSHGLAAHIDLRSDAGKYWHGGAYCSCEAGCGPSWSILKTRSFSVNDDNVFVTFDWKGKLETPNSCNFKSQIDFITRKAESSESTRETLPVSWNNCQTKHWQCNTWTRDCDAGPWKKAAIPLSKGNYDYIAWKAFAQLRGGNLYGYLDNVRIVKKSPYAFTENNVKIYTMTEGRGPCRYEYDNYDFADGQSWQSSKTEEYSTNLDGVDCGNSYFLNFDETHHKYLDYECTNYGYRTKCVEHEWICRDPNGNKVDPWYSPHGTTCDYECVNEIEEYVCTEYSMTDSSVLLNKKWEWWYGPSGYGAGGTDGEEVMGACEATNYQCFSNIDESFCEPECHDYPNTPYSCSLSTQNPPGSSITNVFCPLGTTYTEGGGCCPADTSLYCDGRCYDGKEYLCCDGTAKYMGEAGTWTGDCSLHGSLPQIDFITPQDGETVTSQSITIEGTATPPNMINNDGIVLTVISNGIAFNHTVNYDPSSGEWSKYLNLTDGPNTLVATVINVFGDTASNTITVNYSGIDTTFPELHVSSPTLSNFQFREGDEHWDKEFYGYATDDRGLEGIYYKFNYDNLYTKVAEGEGTLMKYWSFTPELRWGRNRISVLVNDEGENKVKRDFTIAYYKQIIVKPSPPPGASSSSSPVGSVTGVTEGLFNFTNTSEGLLELVDYQRKILDGTHLVAGKDVTYTEEVFGAVESVYPQPAETVTTSNSTLLTWRSPVIDNGESVALGYNVSFELHPLERKNISAANLSYIDGTTGADISTELAPIEIRALTEINLSTHMSKPSYLPGENIFLSVMTENLGEHDLTDLALDIEGETPTGNSVHVQRIDIPLLPARSNVSVSKNLSAPELTAPGNHTVYCTIVDPHYNTTVANASTSFEMLEMVGASMIVSTDASRYSLSDTVDAFAKINNTSPNTALEGAEVVFTLYSGNESVNNWTADVSSVSRGAIVNTHVYFTASDTGTFNLTAVLRRYNGTDHEPLAIDDTLFTVISAPELILEEVLSTGETRALKPVNASVSLQNIGDRTALNTTIIAYLPQNFTPLNHSGTYDNAMNTISWDLGDVSSGYSQNFYYGFLTPFIHSYEPVDYSIQAKAFYADSDGYRTAGTSAPLRVKPIPVIASDVNAGTSEAYIGNDLAVQLDISNIGYDDAVDIEAVVSISPELEVDPAGLAGATIENNVITLPLTTLAPNENFTFNFTATVLPVTEIRNATIDLDIIYHDMDSYTYTNSSSVVVKIIPILVLAWAGDASDEWFADEVTRDIAYVKKVNTTSDLLNELESSFYDVLFLMNMGHCEDNCTEEGGLGSEGIDKISAWLSENTSLTRELVFSDFTLKANPKLGDIAGFKYVGSLPMGKPYQPRNVSVTGSHTLTDGYVGTTLQSVSWLDKVQPEYTHDVLAYTNLSKKGNDTYPALTVSYYNSSRVIFFAPDIGLSSYEGYSADAWTDIVRRSLLWSLEACEEVASLNVQKELKPYGSGAKTHATIEVFSSGSSATQSVIATEPIPPEFILQSTNGNAGGPSSLIWDLGTMQPRASETLEYVLINPEVENVTTFDLITTITYVATDGNKSLNMTSNVTIEPKKGGGKK